MMTMTSTYSFRNSPLRPPAPAPVLTFVTTGLWVVCLLLFSSSEGRAALRPEVIDASSLTKSGTTTPDGRWLDFVSRDGYPLRLLISPDPSDILNPAFDGQLHPVRAGQVREALAETRELEGGPTEVVFYCLPGLPEKVGRSFSVGREVFLSPTFGPAALPQIAATVVHELGHVVQHDRIPSLDSRAWRTYRDLRGLDPQTFRADAVHRNRPKEIFAEDFRMLYGGALANYSGSHENHDLVDPARVEGLTEYFHALLVGGYSEGRPVAEVSNHPNPFNPQTTIEIRLRPEQIAVAPRVKVDIYDLRGRRVRNFDPIPAASVILLPWDGSDDRGQSVASGRYTYRVQVANESVFGSMVLLQ